MSNQFAKEVNELFKKEKINGHQVRCETNPGLHGYWGGDGP